MGKTLLTPDAKGRVSLGKPAEGVVGYRRIDLEDGKILLEPMAAIPAKELWLHQTPGALKSVERGLKQSAAGKVVSLGRFAQQAEEDE